MVATTTTTTHPQVSIHWPNGLMVATLLTKSELLSFNFRKFYFEPDRNVEMGSRH